MTVTPAGKVLPCHASETIKWLQFDNVRDRPLSDIWLNGHAFQAYRGTAWMKEPCKTCDRREIDWGGCRCQALAMTGDAANADPTCDKSEYHAAFRQLAEKESREPSPPFIYRRMGAAAAAAE
jgi:pyrroloquinoline quinone biosynthesis protein E